MMHLDICSVLTSECWLLGWSCTMEINGTQIPEALCSIICKYEVRQGRGHLIFYYCTYALKWVMSSGIILKFFGTYRNLHSCCPAHHEWSHSSYITLKYQKKITALLFLLSFSFWIQKVDMPTPKHRRQLTTWQVYVK